ncbi:hypothetical protein VIS19158_09652 [Vibrio scophthalmi LMG 19158]|uniref:Uncharacterized protein n=1 Tax=Vibrio scophthalmi LMG 19158 TaxID=870967 RepID=F9RQX2_9VIBR|nr:hypothetical protein VIS19158_09652 [Vibrio scophthalmi LMG 19158]
MAVATNNDHIEQADEALSYHNTGNETVCLVLPSTLGTITKTQSLAGHAPLSAANSVGNNEPAHAVCFSATIGLT